MAKEWAKSFYNSKKWQRCRAAFLMMNLYICNRCGEYGDIVHHKIMINKENIKNPNITLTYENLECLCIDCHNKEHNHGTIEVTAEGLRFDSFGNLVRKEKESIIELHTPP